MNIVGSSSRTSFGHAAAPRHSQISPCSGLYLLTIPASFPAINLLSQSLLAFSSTTSRSKSPKPALRPVTVKCKDPALLLQPTRRNASTSPRNAPLAPAAPTNPLLPKICMSLKPHPQFGFEFQRAVGAAPPGPAGSPGPPTPADCQGAVLRLLLSPSSNSPHSSATARSSPSRPCVV